MLVNSIDLVEERWYYLSWKALNKGYRKTIHHKNGGKGKRLIGILSQPGRLGGFMMTPRLLSSGPPQLTPIPMMSSVESPFSCNIRWIVSSIFWIAPIGPPAFFVSKASLRSMNFSGPSFPCGFPSRTALLVPPMSIPMLNFISLPLWFRAMSA